MRITTFNANGIRAAARKGFFAWLGRESPDVLCLQETKAQEHQAPPEALDLVEYSYAFVDAQKKGYSGVAIYEARRPTTSCAVSTCPTWTPRGASCGSDCGEG